MDNLFINIVILIVIINQSLTSRVSETEMAENLLRDMGLSKRPDLKHVSFFSNLFWKTLKFQSRSKKIYIFKYHNHS